MPSLQLYGLPQLTLDDGRVLALSAREAALLAWLQLEGATARARLAGLLWPGGDEARARTNLRQTLARLRRAAGEVLAEDEGTLRLADGVALQPSAEGDLLAGLNFDDAPELAEWLAARRDDARRNRQRERIADAQAQVANGNLDGALALADAMLADEPESEQAWRVRMEVFYLRGDRAAAIAAWDECREALRRAFGVAPSAATNELGRLIMASEAAPAATAAVLPAVLRRPPQTIGRDRVLADIERTLQLRHVVVVVGPGGIGKSRVLAQALATHEPALIVAARAGDRVLPGASFARLLSTALTRFAPKLDEQTQQDVALLLPQRTDRAAANLRSALEHRRVLSAAARALQACAQQGLRVIAIDDLQFADDASIAAVQVVVGAWLADEDKGPGQGVIPVFAARDAELSDEGRALLALLADSRRSVRVELAPLAASDVRSLLAELPLQQVAPHLDLDALATALHAQVGGNPAFLLESVKSLWLDRFASWTPGQPLPVPASLMESLRRRLQRLPEAALQVAQLAAVAQRDFSLALAGASLGRAPLALAPVFAELEAAQVFHGHAFSHDLVAEAVRASLPAALEAPLHQLVADHLIAHDGAAASIAWHLQQAGAAAAAVRWHLKAARLARDRWQLADAASSFEAAADGLQAHPRDLRDVETSAAMAWLEAARWWTAISDYGRALSAIERGMACATTPVERLELRSSRVVVLLNSQRTAESLAAALALADDLQASQEALDPVRLAAALFSCVAVIQHAREPRRLAELCECLRERCSSGPPRARQSFHLSHGLCLSWLAQPQQADRELALARRLAEEIGGHGLIVNVANQQVRTATMQGDYERALKAAADSLQAVQAGGYGPSFRLDGLASRALLHAVRGEPAPAKATLLDAQALITNSEVTAASDAVAMLAIGWLQIGHTARAEAVLRGCADDNGWTAMARARLAPAGSAARTAALAALAQCWPADDSVMGLRRRVFATAIAPPALDEAEDLLRDVQARGLRPLARLAHVHAARAALAARAPARALAHARGALALWPFVDPWVDLPASVWQDAADVLAAAGARDEADAARRAGLRWVEQAAAALVEDADLHAWRDGVSVHRALRTDAARGPTG